MIKTICLVIAIVLFAIQGVHLHDNVDAFKHVDLVALGLAFFAASFLTVSLPITVTKDA